MTVLRKLREIPYLASYSHRGAYYTLRSVAQFDARGLWSHGAVRFSKFGTLIDTVAELVIRSNSGQLVSELVAELQVEVKQPLLNLVRAGRLAREEFGGLYLYTAPDAKRRRQQRLARQATYVAKPFGPIVAGAAAPPDEVKAAIVLFLSTLDEKQRRLFAGLESLRVGRGGDRRIADLTGMDVHTIARGRHELETRDLQLDRIRRPGGGRRSLEKETPQLIGAIEKLLIHDTAGDPITGLKWTRRTTRKIAKELARGGIRVPGNTVARILHSLGFSLRVNHKKLARRSPPNRDRQFRHIARLRDVFQRRGLPVLSVDTKKKELVGQFKSPGAIWAMAPTLVNDHDFRSDALGIAVPYGIFDIVANRGHVVLGTSHDTPAFAVDCLVDWWTRHGRSRYPDADRLLLLADNGGSNGSRCRAWKLNLQRRFCDRFGVAVTLAHYPPGASKWNPIEHRLFSEISKNWAGRPLDSHETMLKYLRTTSTATGLKVTATLSRRVYATGEVVSALDMQKLHLRPTRFMPVWNYSLFPRPASE
ncbi:MAG: ISAzo13 family transposase [Planctomycetes bacterium]|nr:ISAzo13 family transposase [Planctomycetota bacterium]